MGFGSMFGFHSKYRSKNNTAQVPSLDSKSPEVPASRDSLSSQKQGLSDLPDFPDFPDFPGLNSSKSDDIFPAPAHGIDAPKPIQSSQMLPGNASFKEQMPQFDFSQPQQKSVVPSVSPRSPHESVAREPAQKQVLS